MPMILRSGRAKNSLPPVIRPRLPPLVRRHDTEFPGPVFSAQRNARQYTQWEVDISQHLALPETLDSKILLANVRKAQASCYVIRNMPNRAIRFAVHDCYIM